MTGASTLYNRADDDNVDNDDNDDNAKNADGEYLCKGDYIGYSQWPVQSASCIWNRQSSKEDKAHKKMQTPFILRYKVREHIGVEVC